MYPGEEEIETKHRLQIGEEIFIKILWLSHCYFDRGGRLEASWNVYNQLKLVTLGHSLPRRVG